MGTYTTKEQEAQLQSINWAMAEAASSACLLGRIKEDDIEVTLLTFCICSCLRDLRERVLHLEKSLNNSNMDRNQEHYEKSVDRMAQKIKTTIGFEDILSRSEK